MPQPFRRVSQPGAGLRPRFLARSGPGWSAPWFWGPFPSESSGSFPGSPARRARGPPLGGLRGGRAGRGDRHLAIAGGVPGHDGRHTDSPCGTSDALGSAHGLDSPGGHTGRDSGDVRPALTRSRQRLTLSGAARNDLGTRGLHGPVHHLGRGSAGLARTPVLGLGPGEFRRRDGPLPRPRSWRCLRPG